MSSTYCSLHKIKTRGFLTPQQTGINFCFSLCLSAAVSHLSQLLPLSHLTSLISGQLLPLSQIKQCSDADDGDGVNCHTLCDENMRLQRRWLSCSWENMVVDDAMGGVWLVYGGWGFKWVAL